MTKRRARTRFQVQELERRIVMASPTQITQAANEGVAWLASQQNASTGQIGTTYSLADTASAVQTLETKGNFPGGGEQYSSVVEKGLNYVFTFAAKVTNISQHNPGGGANVSCLIPGGDSFGVEFSQDEELYETGIVMAAIAASDTPTRVVTTGALAGMTYQKVLTDMVQFVAWSQYTTGVGEGGWRYTAPSANLSGQADNSVSQWPVLGLSAAAQTPWNLTAPSFVSTELNKWVTYIQGSDGGSGYTTPNSGEDSGVTGGLMVEFNYLGDSSTATRDQNAINYINANWNVTPSGYSGDFGNPYAMFGQFKGLTLGGVVTIPKAAAHPPWSTSGDWYNDYADYLVNHQMTNGSWSAYYVFDTVLTASWYTDILSKTVFVRPPQVQTVQIDDGTSQRSMVRSLTVTFQDPAVVAAGAFQLTTPAGSPPVTLNVSPALGSGNPFQTYTITFSGAGIIGNSLPDGLYTLTIKASGVQNVAGQNLAADVPVSFFRLFADYTGDGFVDNLDLAYLRLAAAGNPLYVQYFDYNGDGVVNSVDTAQAIARRYENIFAPDVTPPVVAYTAPAYGTYTKTNVTVTGVVTDNLSGVASLVGEIDSGPTFPVSYNVSGNFSFTTALALDGSADGLHTVHLVATDVAGNVSVRYDDTFVLVTQAPVVTYTKPVAGSLTNTNPTVTGTVTSLATVTALQASVDGGAASAIPFSVGGAFSFTTGLRLDGTADGLHTVHVIATDSLGNVSASYNDTFVLDTTPPVVTYAGPPSGSHTSTNPTITGQVVDAISGVASLQGQIDNGPTFPVTIGASGSFSVSTAFPLDGTADGLHTLHMIATDMLGNVSGSYDYAIVIDTTPPVVTYSTPAPGSDTRTNPVVSGVVTDLTGVAQLLASVDGGLAFAVSVGSGGTFSFTTALALDGTADGPHTVYLIATDPLGNVSGSYDDTFVLDTTPPVVTYSTPTAGSTVKTNTTVSGKVVDALSGVASLQGQVDNGPTFPVTIGASGSFSFTTSLALDGTADGPHTIHLIATDALGNVSGSYDDTFVLNTQGPKVIYLSPASGSFTRTNPQVSGEVTSTMGVASLVGQVDSGPMFPVMVGPGGAFSFTTALPLDGSADGSHTVHLIGTDLLGNSSASYDDTFVLDTTPPTVVYTSPSPGSTIRTGPTVTGQVVDALSGAASLVGQVDSGPTFPVSLDATGHFSFTASLALDGSADGAHTIHLVATDKVGNVSAIYDDSFLLDTSVPTVSYTTPTPGSASRTNPFVTGTITRPSGVELLEAQVDSGPLIYVSFDPTGTFQYDTTLPTDGSADGLHTIHMFLTEKNGQTYGPFDDSFLLETQPPVVTVTESASTATLGSTVTIAVSATDKVEVPSLGLTVGGVPVTLDSSGKATITASQVGTFPIVATATDQAGNVSAQTITLIVYDPNDHTPPSVSFTVGNGSPITGPIDVIGTVSSPTLVSYELVVTPIDGGASKTIFTGSSSVVNGNLGMFDPTLLLDDSYTVQLTATDANGDVTTVTDPNPVSVAGNLKLGNYSVTFTDLSIPVGGIPITIARRYDTLDAGNSEDFGYGWRLEFGDTDLRTSVPKTGYENLGDYNAFKYGTRVYVTLPGGLREGFTFTPQRDPGPLGSFLGVLDPAFTPDPGVTDTLRVAPAYLLQAPDGTYVNYPIGYPYNPANPILGGTYTLTTEMGDVYTIDGNSGKLDTVANANGDTLTFSESGITSSTGVKVAFTRDSLGRITAITDPMGGTINYTYDADGDLASVTDLMGNTTHFVYDQTQEHYLDQVIDPLGRTGIRNDYDAQGRLIQLTRADGTSVALNSDPTLQTETVVDALGNPTTYQYDAQGNTVTQVDALGGITTWTYDANNNKLSETDPLGNTTRYTYDAKGDILTQTDPLGNVTRYTYDSMGDMLTEVDPNGATTTNIYDAQGNLLKTTDPLGHVTTYTYDSIGDQLTVTDPNGNVTYNTYDYRGDLVRQVDPLGDVTTYTYDQDGHQLSKTTTQTTPTGTRTLVTTTTYNAAGAVTSVTDPDGGVTRYTYDADGRQTSVTDPLGLTTTSVYDVDGRLIETDYPDGTSTKTQYDAQGNRVASIDQAGRVTRYTYDELNRLVATTAPDGSTTRTEYNATGLVTADIDANGHETEYGYDVLGNQTSVRDPSGAVTTDTYDAAGNVTSQTDANGNLTLYTYDLLDELTKTTYANGTSTSTTYNADGKVTSQTDQDGETTQFLYDALNRLIGVVDPTGGKTTYTYDEIGDLTSEENADGEVTRYEYDGLGHRTAVTLPMGQRSITSYDADGRVTSTTDADGNTITYTYDNAGRLTTEQFPDGTSDRFTYSPTGKRLTATDASGTTSYTYDSLDRLLSVTEPDGQTIGYTYDAVGNVTSITSLAGTTVYTYDADDRLLTVTDPSSAVTSYSYDAVGNLVRINRPDSTVETLTYDTLNRLVGIDDEGPSGPILTEQYTLSPTGQRVAVTELGGRTEVYTYDALGRLISDAVRDPTAGNRTTTYTYDAVGNRLTEVDSQSGTTTYTYDADDQLLTETQGATVTRFTYDADGNNLSQYTDALDQVILHWDFKNELIGENVTTPAGTQDVTYQYDVDGDQVSSTLNGQETRYLVDLVSGLSQILADYTPAGVLVASYVRGQGLISEDRGGTVSYYHADALGSTRALTNASGVVTDRYTYDAFGATLVHTGTTVNPYQFEGERLDPTTQLYQLRARSYDPSTGGFVSKDPNSGDLTRPVTLQGYVYAGADPVNEFDPTGRGFIPSNLIYGNIVDKEIGAQFMFDGLGHLYNRGLNTIINSQITGYRLFIPNGRLRPDLIDLLFHELYEVKSLAQAAEGEAKLVLYLTLLNAFDPTPPAWGPGYHFVPLPEIPVTTFVVAIVSPPAGGLILYQLYDRTEDLEKDVQTNYEDEAAEQSSGTAEL